MSRGGQSPGRQALQGVHPASAAASSDSGYLSPYLVTSPASLEAILPA